MSEVSAKRLIADLRWKYGRLPSCPKHFLSFQFSNSPASGRSGGLQTNMFCQLQEKEG
ncbi:MAG: hypothetical protein ACFFBD_03755 [Candidatus Hodarchaeota archaeon]